MSKALTNLDSLLSQLGVDIDPELLLLALTHRSWAYEHDAAPHNERLEFLGDSVLGLAVTEWLYLQHPDSDEGELAKRRAAVVSTVALAEVARGIGLGEFIRLGRGEDRSGGRDKDSILADTTEAVFGAVFLSAGVDAAKALILRLLQPLLNDPNRTAVSVDPKTAVQELAASLGLPHPVYELSASGPDHNRTFAAEITIGDFKFSGSGSSKKQAEMAAALIAWKNLSANA